MGAAGVFDGLRQPGDERAHVDVPIGVVAVLAPELAQLGVREHALDGPTRPVRADRAHRIAMARQPRRRVLVQPVVALAERRRHELGRRQRGARVVDLDVVVVTGTADRVQDLLDRRRAFVVEIAEPVQRRVILERSVSPGTHDVDATPSPSSLTSAPLRTCSWGDCDTAVYDFAFDRLLACRRPYQLPAGLTAIARVGAIPDYEAYYRRWADQGVRLIHTPDEHRRASELPSWYPILEGLTPKSLWSAQPPTIALIEKELGWPIFLKGSRQTSRHKKSLSIIEGPEAYVRALDEYSRDSILFWQDLVCRRYVPLRPVEDAAADRIPSSFEFRTFWWYGELAGFGRYWWEGRRYDVTRNERQDALALAAEAARRVNVPFLEIDLAQDAAGTWLVIECNDGQESGYAGVSAIGLWQKMVEVTRQRDAASGPPRE